MGRVGAQRPFDLADPRLNRGPIIGPDMAPRLAAWFVAPGEPPSLARARVRALMQPEAWGPNRHLDVQVEGRWIAARQPIIEG